MFLFERIIGVGVYCVALLTVCMLIGYSRIKLKVLLWLYTFVLGMMGYFYLPYKTSDLYRIFHYLTIFKRFNYNDFFNIHVKTSSSPGGRILYWVFSKIGDPHLLPAFAAIVCYGICFYILYGAYKRFRVNRRTTALVMFFFMSIGHYMSVISNIRTMLAICLIAFCFFREENLQKFSIWHIPLYLAALSLHNLAIVFLLIRLSAILFASKTSIWIRILTVAALLILALLLQLLLPAFVDSLADKASEYLSGDSYTYSWEYIMGILVMLAEGYFLFVYYRAKVESPLSLRTQNSALLLSLVLSIVFIGVFTFYYRIVSGITAVLCIPILMELLSDQGALRFSRKLSIPLRGTTCVIAAAELGLSCVRGSLCSLKFFVLGG